MALSFWFLSTKVRQHIPQKKAFEFKIIHVKAGFSVKFVYSVLPQ
jgi:hypothetical protein